MRAELLAPAGSYEAMTAAYHAGADAVYIGGEKFGRELTRIIRTARICWRQ